MQNKDSKLFLAAMYALRQNFFSIIVLLFLLLFYYEAQAGVAWYVYLVTALIAAERGLIQLRILITKWIADMAMKEMTRRVQAQLMNLPGEPTVSGQEFPTLPPEGLDEPHHE